MGRDPEPSQVGHQPRFPGTPTQIMLLPPDQAGPARRPTSLRLPPALAGWWAVAPAPPSQPPALRPAVQPLGRTVFAEPGQCQGFRKTCPLAAWGVLPLLCSPREEAHLGSGAALSHTISPKGSMAA
ncbi:Cardiac-Enriched Fhl2-Interacting Protein [Manis pentadactyla]|nr:Cardiac-Enriched Fhl2-Interacting Protein [Manis pentadactyla]